MGFLEGSIVMACFMFHGEVGVQNALWSLCWRCNDMVGSIAEH